MNDFFQSVWIVYFPVPYLQLLVSLHMWHGEQSLSDSHLKTGTPQMPEWHILPSRQSESILQGGVQDIVQRNRIKSRNVEHKII